MWVNQALTLSLRSHAMYRLLASVGMNPSPNGTSWLGIAINSLGTCWRRPNPMLYRKYVLLIMSSTTILLCRSNDIAKKFVQKSSISRVYTSSSVNPVKNKSSSLWPIWSTSSEEANISLIDCTVMTCPSWMNFTFWWREEGMVQTLWIQGRPNSRFKDVGILKT